MQELTIHPGKKTGAQVKRVHLFIRSNRYELSGSWQWELEADVVFCSDVMMTPPPDFRGTRALIHPDDVEKLLGELSVFPHLRFINPRFRIITSYGVIKTLTGKYIELDAAAAPPGPDEEVLMRRAMGEVEERRNAEHLQIHREIWERAERLQETATFYFNSRTHRGWFSDQAFRIHGLPPQSLNANLHTFSSYIHPDDRDVVVDAMDHAYREELPLHLVYRILTASGEEKHICLNTGWVNSPQGDRVMTGLLKDETREKLYEDNAERLQQEVGFQKQMVYLDEQAAQLGHWYINLLTRKMVFSDNCYRLHGLRQKLMISGMNTFGNFIHPDDVDRVLLAYRNMTREHQLPELEYRIVRSDGKTRYLRQSGRSVAYGGEVVIYGIMQDITAERVAEQKLKELTEAGSVRHVVMAQSEQVAGMGHWVFDPQTEKHNWSDGFYALLGYKTSTLEPSMSQFIKLVYFEDRKKVRTALETVLEEKQEAQLEFRIIRMGILRNVRAWFKILQYEARELLITTLLDITATKNLEQQLQEKLQLAEALTENIFDRIYITDLNNNIVFWSRPCEQLFGLKREDVLGKNYFDLLPRFKTEQVMADFAHVLKAERIEYKKTWSAPFREFQDQHMIPLQNAEGEVFGILHINRNMTREVELQRSLSERLKFIESLVESSVDRVIVLDRNMNYQYWNLRAEEYYGISKGDVLRKNILEVFPGFVNDPSYQEFRRVLKGETVHITAQHNLEARKGYFETYLIPIRDEAEQVIAVLWIVHDLVSEYQLLQQQRKATYILDTINEIYIELDDDARLRYVNKKAEDTWKKERKQLIGTVLWDVFREEKDSAVRLSLENCLEQRLKLRGEFFATSLNRWLYISATPAGDGMIVLLYDVHEARQARTQLEKEHRRLKEAQSIGKLGSFEWEATTDTISWSDELYRIHGLTPGSEAITLDRVLQFIHPDDVAATRQKVQECKQTAGPFTITNRIMLADGTVKTIRSQFQSYADESGQVAHLAGTILDITEQKTAEDRILRQLHILQQTEDLTRSGSWEYDLKTGEFTWSEGMYRLFGMQQGVPVAPEIYKEYALAEDQAAARRIVKHIKKGTAFEEQLWIRSGGGSVLLRIKATVQSVKGQEKVYGVDLDITEINRSEEEIRKGRHLLEEVAKASPDAITIYDLEQKQPLYLNNCLSEWTGKSFGELVRMGIQGRLQLIHPDDRLPLLHHNEKIALASDREVLTIEYRIVSKEGSYRWIRNRSKIFERNEKGKVTKMLSVLQDHTREVELRHQLEQRTHYAESVIDASIDRIMVLDKEQRIIAWNRRTEEITGIRKEHALGKKITEIFPKVDEQAILKNALENSLCGEPVYLPAMKGVYTNIYYERFYIPLKNAAGDTYAVLVLMHDVSDLVSRNEELKQLNNTLTGKNRELELKNEEITHFAFVASHDLKEPLRKISTFASWLLEREQQQLSGTATVYLEKIGQAVKRMDTLIGDIMVLTRIHTDPASDEPTDFGKVLEQVQADLKDTLEACGGRISAEQLPTLLASEKQIFYLFKNLVSNALKFQPKGNVPEIVIRSEQVAGTRIRHGMAHKDLDYQMLSFIDNGIGFDNSSSRKIFQVFTRLHNRQDYVGTGMGLAICKKIMENHKGFITAEGTPGAGAVFSCYFPIAD